MTDLWGRVDFLDAQDQDSLFALGNDLENQNNLEEILNYWVLWHSASIKKRI
jgi:hypothetical protein